MGGRKQREVPTPLARGRERFETWRRTRKTGTRIPARLWTLAVKLAVAHGLNRTASELRLDYYSLKKRVEAANHRSRSATSAFVELPPPAISGECVIEFEDGAGDLLQKKGHGRNAADAYQGAEQIDVPHASLQPGDPCPECTQGTVYEVATPGVLVRVVGQAPLHATVYHLQKLRCHLCGKVFTARSPEEAGERKYDATAASMIALLKYGSGMPFNRVAGLQRNLEIPLPASTQWDVIAAFAPAVVPVYEALIKQAADGEVLYNDDTTVKILELMGERAKKQPLDDDLPGRTGLFTSGVVATREGRRLTFPFRSPHHVP